MKLETSEGLALRYVMLICVSCAFDGCLTRSNLVWGLGSGFRVGVWGVGCGVWGVGCGVWELGFEVWSLGFENQVSRYAVRGLVFVDAISIKQLSSSANVILLHLHTPIVYHKICRDRVPTLL